MANRPLPNVDPEALSKLASQYPGSGDVRSEPKLGGGGTGGTSGSGGSGSGAAGTPKAVPVAQAGGGARRKPGAAVATGLFAVVAVAAAVAALAAPSLRSEARVLLQRHVPQLDASTVDFITGHDTRRLEVTYEGLDQRVARLTEALQRIAVAPGIDPAAARELLLRTESNERVEAAEAALAAQTAAVAAVSDRVGAVEARLVAFDEIRQSLDALVARAETADQSVAGLRETIDTLGTQVGGLGDEDKRLASLVEEASGKLDATSGRLQELAAEIARAHDGLAPVAALTNQVAAQRKAMELPLIGMTQLRMALNRETPYRMELALAKQLVADDSEAVLALSALDLHAGAGVASLPGLRRDFAFVATQMGGTLNRIQSWTQRLGTWVEVLVGTRSVPEADPIGELSAAIASIDAALEAGQLDLAIEEAAALSNRQSDALLEGWIAEARRRLATERAFDQFAARVYARIGTSG